MFGKYLDKYNDVLLGVVLIPIINTINYHLTYSTIRWDWYTLATYSIDTVSGYLSWWIIRSIVVWLDRVKPFESGLVRRLVLQVTLTNFAVLSFTIIATEGVNALYTDQPLPTQFYTYNLFIFFIWILVINGIYTGLYFYDQWRITQHLRDRDREVQASGLKVQQGKKVIKLPFERLGAIYLEDGTAFIQTLDNRRFVSDSSLNRIEEILPPQHFFRVNRKYILNRGVIQGYNKKSHGKLMLELKADSGLPDKPVVSRLTAPAFKDWFQLAVYRA